MKQAIEIQIDGLPGPTHLYGGLGLGNLASQKSKLKPSNPRQAALQSLAKMKMVSQLGVPQYFLPPQPVPHLRFLSQLGFNSPLEKQLQNVYLKYPDLLTACYSSAGMWAANAATIRPSSDGNDHQVHITPANLISQIHRSLESSFTAKVLKKLFPPGSTFNHHRPLPASLACADEGAANHTRFSLAPGQKGLHLFVHGPNRNSITHSIANRKFSLARQSEMASRAIARLHRIPEEQCEFIPQNPVALEAGAFHNDVLAVGHRRFFFFHELAYVNGSEALQVLSKKFQALSSSPLALVLVRSRQVSLSKAIKSYLFNSQFIDSAANKKIWIAPEECRLDSRLYHLIENEFKEKLSVDEVCYLNLGQSMDNGGGPACLRLRMELSVTEIAQLAPQLKWTPKRHRELVQWVNQYYPDRLNLHDLVDPSWVSHCKHTFEALQQLLGLPRLYY